MSIFLKSNIKLLLLVLGCAVSLSAFSQEPNSLKIKVTKKYLNIPITREADKKLVRLSSDGELKREIPVQITEGTIDYWIFIDVTEFKNKTITLSSAASFGALNRIYQDDKIADVENLYKEARRPQFHFSVKRGWSNDINGLIYYNNKYHMFWQAYPFGTDWNTTYMYWGHAISDDLIHWEELAPALMLDKLGSPWSGTAVIDKNNDGGWGKDAMVIYYTAYDGLTRKQVQCIAYSTDEAKTFTRYEGNPIIDSNREMNSVDTRDPKVFWYEPGKHWAMVLFEVNGLSFYSSQDMKEWKKESFFEGLWECPDFFELPLDGDSNKKKWVLHGGSSDYFVGSFDGKTFTAETERKKYNEDILYAAITFENMPNDRRVQIAWGRGIDYSDMPFNHIMLFPTEFNLRSTAKGPQLMATPISEIELLHSKSHTWSSLTAKEANKKMEQIPTAPMHVKMKVTFDKGGVFRLRYQGEEFINISANEFLEGENEVEILIDKSVAEIFINKGDRYIVKGFKRNPANNKGLEFDSENYAPFIKNIEIHEMKSIWEKAILENLK